MSKVTIDEAKLRQALGDELILNTDVCADLNIADMTAARWDDDPAMQKLGWPERIVLNRRIYRSGAKYRAFKERLIEKAIQERSVITRDRKRRREPTA